LGFPLPPDLRRLYAQVANGGAEVGVDPVLYGAAGGCPCLEDWPAERTIGQLVSRSGWRLHPHIEEMLLHFPDRYVLADAVPEGFIRLGDLGYGNALEIDGATGRLYRVDRWAEAADERASDSADHFPVSISCVASSLEEWIARWLDERDAPYRTWRPWLNHRGPLTADLVETAELSDSQAVWRGLYRIESPRVQSVSQSFYGFYGFPSSHEAHDSPDAHELPPASYDVDASPT